MSQLECCLAIRRICHVGFVSCLLYKPLNFLLSLSFSSLRFSGMFSIVGHLSLVLKIGILISLHRIVYSIVSAHRRCLSRFMPHVIPNAFKTVRFRKRFFKIASSRVASQRRQCHTPWPK